MHRDGEPLHIEGDGARRAGGMADRFERAELRQRDALRAGHHLAAVETAILRRDTQPFGGGRTPVASRIALPSAAATGL